MPWKKKADGALFTNDAGDPIWLKDDNAEQIVPGDGIARLNAEARDLRIAKEAAETKLKTFDGIEPDKARDAIAKLKDVDLSKLVGQDKVDEIRKQIKSDYEAQIHAKDEAYNKLQSQTRNAVLDASFASSKFIGERVASPAGMFKDSFSKSFKFDDEGKMYAVDSSGNMIYNERGERAGFDEAIAKLVDNHPDKKMILKAQQSNGTGNPGNGTQTGGDVRKVLRSDFDAMPPAQQAAVAGEAREGKVTIANS